MNGAPTRDQLVSLILGVLEGQNPTLPHPVDIRKGADAQLFGRGGPLDSIGLVTLIIEVETVIEDTFGVPVLLADERAVSQQRSPFRTVGSLAAYAETVLSQAGVQTDP